MLIAGLTTFESTLLVLALPPLVYLALGALIRPGSVRFRAESRLNPPLAKPGEAVEVELQLTNEGGRLEELYVEDRLPAGLLRIEGASSLVTSVSSGAEQGLSYRLGAATGLYSWGATRLSASDPFGLFESHLELELDRTLLVRPSVKRIRRLYLRPPRVAAQAGAYPSRMGGSGIEFYGIRDYSPGDPWRRISWKVSARFPGRLFVNVFEQDRMAEIGLIVDARAGSNADLGADSVFGVSVQAAASLSELLLSQGNRVGLLVYGGHLDWSLPGTGKVQRERILRALARASLGHSQIFDELRNLPSRLFPQHTQLILFSPLLRTDVEDLIRLRARRYPLLVISPDQVELEAKSLSSRSNLEIALRLARLEQAVISRRLAQAGVYRLLWNTQIPFEELIEMHLSRPAPWLAAIGGRL